MKRKRRARGCAMFAKAVATLVRNSESNIHCDRSKDFGRLMDRTIQTAFFSTIQSRGSTTSLRWRCSPYSPLGGPLRVPPACGQGALSSVRRPLPRFPLASQNMEEGKPAPRQLEYAVKYARAMPPQSVPTTVTAAAVKTRFSSPFHWPTEMFLVPLESCDSLVSDYGTISRNI